MKKIDVQDWDRYTHYKFFRQMDYPQYNICMDLDITKFLTSVKQKELPFYYAMIYATMKVANEVEEFRYRMRGEDIILHEQLHPSFTDMSAQSDLFKIVTTNYIDSLDEFIKTAEESSKNQKEFIRIDQERRDDLIYITCLPWISFTQITHTITLNKEDAIPRISWGKYYTTGSKTLLPFSVQVHHSFVDGIHIGKFVNSLQTYLNDFIINS